MCFKRKPMEMTAADARFITTCKNTYGKGNDLRGCLNDGNNFLKTCRTHGKDHKAYHWRQQIDPRWTAEQIAAYREGYAE